VQPVDIARSPGNLNGEDIVLSPPFRLPLPLPFLPSPFPALTFPCPLFPLYPARRSGAVL